MDKIEGGFGTGLEWVILSKKQNQYFTLRKVSC